MWLGESTSFLRVVGCFKRMSGIPISCPLHHTTTSLSGEPEHSLITMNESTIRSSVRPLNGPIKPARKCPPPCTRNVHAGTAQLLTFAIPSQMSTTATLRKKAGGAFSGK